MSDNLNIGLNLREVDGSVSRPIPAPPTSIAGFIILVHPAADGEQAVDGETHRITSVAGFEELFGARVAGFGRHAIRGYFANGGAVALVHGITDATAAAVEAALSAYEAEDVTLLCSPEDYGDITREVIELGCAHASGMGDRAYIAHTPKLESTGAGPLARWLRGVGGGADLLAGRKYGAIYGPWVRVSSPGSAGGELVPPEGHVLGVFARTDRERGLWKAPAGTAANLRGVLGTEFATTAADHDLMVRKGHINTIRSVPGFGTIVDGARTLTSDVIWRYVGTRLLFNYVKSSLKAGLRFAVHEPNDETLWKRIEHGAVRPFLLGLWRRGAFGEGSPDDLFTVRIDAENNPPAAIDRGELTVEIYFYPVRPAETIVITIGQQDAGGSAAEA